MTVLFAVLVALSAFFACLGTLRLGAGQAWSTHRQRLLEGWAANRLRQRYRSGIQRARLRAIR